MNPTLSQFSASTYRVFLSDLHGQGDVFDYLLQEKFGVVEKLVVDASSGCNALESLYRHYLIPGNTVAGTVYGEMAHVSQMLKLLLGFKSQRRFWPVCVEVFSSCSWILAIIEQCALRGEVVEGDLESILLLDVQDRDSLCQLVGKAVHCLLTYRLYIVGDIYDRGANAPEIMDKLEKMSSVSIQWGNHDVLWMGAASGSLECIATVVRLCIRYGHIDTLTKDYEIALDSLKQLSVNCYSDDPCENFIPFDKNESWSAQTLAAMHKAISIIQFKLEQQIIRRNANFSMGERLVLDRLDIDAGEMEVNGERVELTDTKFPTLNRESPSSLTEDEWGVIEDLKSQFVGSTRLQRHVHFLFSNGSLIETDENYVMFHGCVPVDEEGNFMSLSMAGRELSGSALFDALELQLRKAHSRRNASSCKYLSDVAWYLWCGPRSPLFGKQQMTTFERYFISDDKYHHEGKNSYFTARNDTSFVQRVSVEMGGEKDSIVVNGHVPVKLASGESPRHAEGQLLCIDGGFSKAYRSRTGAAGMVLIANNENHQLFSVEEINSSFQLFEI
ncbi:fructose-bisphosphatase class III [Gilvimarinus sp. SDUM040013]|uniref:Fructose-bisphosphatase class III n=1 Tax=Gilvimarinus gilvus TaxID=3058038 RepID=A0ABU4S408_9GAMM|nr:fructose-bisphosphatase class III [Gilvimarinus sp. SDUM040013]MDO3385914.1 fructose-bisphosphatase class III [Gilvimarinus sp. SDUM040013]MDX6850583.1 fructose-bisphosphatase class III [Gilvimarinus sp. SDUM040013]